MISPQLILGLMLLCVPFEIRSSGFLIQRNCVPVNQQFFDETWERVKAEHPSWVTEALPAIARIMVATYSYPKPQSTCSGSVLYAVMSGEMFGSQVIVLHPRIFRDLDGAALFRALNYAASVAEWKQPANSGEWEACLE